MISIHIYLYSKIEETIKNQMVVICHGTSNQPFELASLDLQWHIPNHLIYIQDCSVANFVRFFS